MVDGPGDECAIERAGNDGLGEHRRRPGAKRQLHLRMTLVELRQERRQANRCRGFHRADSERPLGNAIITRRGQRFV